MSAENQRSTQSPNPLWALAIVIPLLAIVTVECLNFDQWASNVTPAVSNILAVNNPATPAAPAATEQLYLVKTLSTRDTTQRRAHSLSAVVDAGGVLKGNDSSGQAVISIPAANLAKLQNSASVKNVSATVPATWNPATQLKLSYDKFNPLTPAELTALGLQLVEDYAPGSFLIVEPLKGKSIDAPLIKKLEQCAKVSYTTPVFKVKVVP